MAQNKPFRQLYADEHDELFLTLIKDSLLWTIFTLCTIRARRKLEPSPEGLEQGEFWLSQMEYEKFGLKETQKTQIVRRLKTLQNLRLVSKTNKRIGNDGANVYRLESSKLININLETNNETNNERIETIMLKEKNDRKNIIVESKDILLEDFVVNV